MQSTKSINVSDAHSLECLLLFTIKMKITRVAGQQAITKFIVRYICKIDAETYMIDVYDITPELITYFF